MSAPDPIRLARMVNQVEELEREKKKPSDPIQLVWMVNQVEQVDPASRTTFFTDATMHVLGSWRSYRSRLSSPTSFTIQASWMGSWICGDLSL
jgi:hypothetical protein